MTIIKWDQDGQRVFETGVSKGVLYPKPDRTYAEGVAWNGLISVSESPSGAESNPVYADNIKYLNLMSVEEFGATIEAYTYPDEFAACDGSISLTKGVTAGQQNRVPFGFSYVTKVGNDQNSDLGYKIHLVYGAQAAPSEKAYNTINDSPEAITFSWEITTTPVSVPGAKPSSHIIIDSTLVKPANLAELEKVLYGTTDIQPKLPLPEEVLEIMNKSLPS